MKARRLIYNRNYNDFNKEPQYKLQKVRIHEEFSWGYIVDSGSDKFKCGKSKVFKNKEDFNKKIDNIPSVFLTEQEKEELLKSW